MEFTFKLCSRIILFAVLIFIGGACDVPNNESAESSIHLEKLWSVNVDAAPSPYFIKYYNNLIFCTIGLEDFGMLKANNGKLLWHINQDTQAVKAAANFSMIAVDESQVYFNMLGRLFCYNYLTGEHKYDIRNFVEGTPIDQEKIFVINSENELVAVNKFTGHTIWSQKVMGRAFSPPVIDGKFIYVSMAQTGLCSPSSCSELLKLDIINGDIIIRKEVTIPNNDRNTDGGSFGPPLVTSNLLLIENGDFRIYAFDKTTLEIVWTFDTECSVRRTILSADNNYVYFGTQFPAKTFALDLLDGHMVWETSSIKGGASSSVPKIYGNFIFLAATDGYLYCLDKNTGDLIFKLKDTRTPVISNDTLWVSQYNYNNSNKIENYLSAYKIKN